MQISKLVIDIDTTAIEVATAKLAVLEAALLRAKDAGKGLKPQTFATDALPAQFDSFAIDPLESAIQSVVSLLRDERESDAGQIGVRTVVCQRLESHLEQLLTLQLKQVGEHSQAEGIASTEISSGRVSTTTELPSYFREYLEGIHWHIKKAVDAIEKGGKPTEPA